MPLGFRTVARRINLRVIIPSVYFEDYSVRKNRIIFSLDPRLIEKKKKKIRFEEFHSVFSVFNIANKIIEDFDLDLFNDSQSRII